ncbi:unnamed protein product, partial [Meganyctiphanes norvegica]
EGLHPGRIQRKVCFNLIFGEIYYPSKAFLIFYILSIPSTNTLLDPTCEPRVALMMMMAHGTTTMADDEEREVRTSNIAIIREVYDSDSAHETFELELERALEAGTTTILIEPTTLGDETARWIAVGNCLHKTAVMTGFGSIFAASPRDANFFCVLLCSYSILGQVSIAICYQYMSFYNMYVEHDSGRLSRLPLHSLSSASPVVLIRKDDQKRKILHSSVSIAAFSYCMWRLYQQLYK